MDYDFLIYNEHFLTNNWITQEMLASFNKLSFCIVTEVGHGNNIIQHTPDFFDNYIVLDPTINGTDKLHAFCRPLEDFKIINDTTINTVNTIPKIGSFGMATTGKYFDKIK